jgi:hypothetical protein
MPLPNSGIFWAPSKPSDLLPKTCTSYFSEAFINPENDGEENK